MAKNKTAQDLCSDLFTKVEMPMSDAWISDEPSTDDPEEYLRLVRGHLAALEEARGVIKSFLRKYKALPRRETKAARFAQISGGRMSVLEAAVAPDRKFNAGGDGEQ